MKIAVYGTLKQGYGNHARILAGRSVFVGSGLTARKFVMINRGFPVIQERDGQECFQVSVQVYDIGKTNKGKGTSTLRTLDSLESEGYMYHRQPHGIILDSGQRVTADLYVGSARFDQDNPDHEKYLQDGVLTWRP